MPQPDLQIRIGINSEQAARELKKWYTQAANVQAASRREQMRLGQMATREQIKTDEQRLRSATRVALEEQRLAKETERVKTEALRRVILAQKEADRQADRARKQSQGGGSSDMMTMIGAASGRLLGGTAALAALRSIASEVGDAINIAGQLEKTLHLLQAQTDATDEEMRQLGDTARTLGADITIPKASAQDAATVLLELAKAGLSVRDSMDAARGTLLLAAAANISAGQAAEITADALNTFKLSGDKATMVADLLAAASLAAQGKITDLAQGMSQAGAVFMAAQGPVVGAEKALRDLTTVMTMMQKAGVKGSDGGTSIKTAIQALQDPTKESAAVMKALNIQIYDAAGRMKDTRTIIDQVTKGVAGLTQQERDRALATIFGSDAVRTANIVLTQSTRAFDEQAEATNKSAQAAKLGEANTKGYAGAVDGLKNAMEDAKERAVAPFLNLLADGVKTTSAFVGGLSDIAQAGAALNNEPWWGTMRTKIKGLLSDMQEYFSLSGKVAKFNASGAGRAATALEDINFLNQNRTNPSRLDNKPLERVLQRYGELPPIGGDFSNPFDQGDLRNRIDRAIAKAQGVVDTFQTDQARLRQEAKDKAWQDRFVKAADAQQHIEDFIAGEKGAEEKKRRLAAALNGGGGGGRGGGGSSAANRARQQASGAKTEAARRNVQQLEDKYDGLLKQLGNTYGPQNRAAILRQLEQVMGDLVEAQESEARARLSEDGGLSNPEAVQRFRTAQYNIQQDRATRREEIGQLNAARGQDYHQGFARGQADMQEYEIKRNEIRRATGAVGTGLGSISSGLGSLFGPNYKTELALPRISSGIGTGFNIINGAFDDLPGFLADSDAKRRQRFKEASVALFYAARSGKQTDLARAFGLMDATRVGGRRGIEGMREEMGLISQFNGMAGSRLQGREAAPFILRRLEQIKSDAAGAGDSALMTEVEDALQRWRQGMNESAKMWSDSISSNLGGALSNTLADWLSGNTSGDLMRRFANNLVEGISQDVAREMGDRFARSARAELEEWMTSAKGGFGSLFKGAEQSALHIALTGYGLLGAIQSLMNSQRGGGGGLLGGILGGIAGSFLPGIGWLAGASFGANLGRGNYLGAAAALLPAGIPRPKGGGGNPGDLTYTYNNGGVAVGKSRAEGGPVINLTKNHYGDVYDRVDQEQMDQGLVRDLRAVLSMHS